MRKKSAICRDLSVGFASPLFAKIITENFSLGNHVEIGSFTIIDAMNSVNIEDNVKIGWNCTIMSNSTIDYTTEKFRITEQPVMRSAIDVVEILNKTHDLMPTYFIQLNL